MVSQSYRHVFLRGVELLLLLLGSACRLLLFLLWNGKSISLNFFSRNGINFHCFWLSFECLSTLPSLSALVCHLPTPPLACPLPFPISATSSLSLNIFRAQNMAFHLNSCLSHTKPMEFNFSSRSGSNLSLARLLQCSTNVPNPSALVCHLPTPPLACPLPCYVSATSPPFL